MKKIYLTLLLVAMSAGLYAQAYRFKQEVFTDAQIKVDSNITYASAMNFSPAVMVPLRMDVYHPDTAIDTLNRRPVIIIFHSGSFLPANINAGSPSNGGAYLGTRRDSAIVEMCRRFARRGWVAIAGTHRLGWIANSPSSNTQKITIMRAVYRATQDGRTLMRYMRRSVDSMGNLYRIDGNRIVIGGTSSGAYVALHANSLDDPNDIMTPGLLDSLGNSVIDTLALGGFYAGMYPGYNSKPNLVLSLGGAIADTAIMSSADAPIIAFHGVMDPTTPFNRGIVKNAGTLAPITTVDGSNSFMLAANNKGISGKVVLAGGTGSRPGLYPFINAGFEPYGWYNKPPLFAPSNFKGRAMIYIDTIMNVFSDYAISILDLDVNDPSGIETTLKDGFKIYPNPATESITVEAVSGNTILSIGILSMDGKLVYNSEIHADTAVINSSDLTKGIYTILIMTDNGIISRQLMIE